MSVVIRNCLNCKYCTAQYYQENLCRSPEVKGPYTDRFGNICGSSYPSTHEVHPEQHTECKYFKIGFLAKIALTKSKICSWIYSKINKR